MVDKKTIHEDVEDGMKYLERMESIELDNYFDIRVNARIRELEKERSVIMVPGFKRVPRLAFIILLCLINLVSVVYFSGIFSPGAGGTRHGDGKITEDTYVEAVRAAYSPAQNDHDLMLIKKMKTVAAGE